MLGWAGAGLAELGGWLLAAWSWLFVRAGWRLGLGMAPLVWAGLGWGVGGACWAGLEQAFLLGGAGLSWLGWSRLS